MKRKFEHNESIIKSHLFLKDLSKNLNRLVILSSPFLAEQIFENAKKEIGQRSVYFLPHSETLPYDFFSSSNEIKNERIRTLSKINYQMKQDMPIYSKKQKLILNHYLEK